MKQKNSLLMSLFEKNKDIGLLILRVAIGGMMLMHGIHKLIGGIDFIKDMLSVLGLPSFIAYGSIIGEVIAPILILVGWRTRIAAAIVTFNMAIAIVMVHLHHLFTIDPTTGGWAIELPALYLLMAATLWFTGSGKIAVSSNKRFD